MASADNEKRPRRELDLELDRFERTIAELKVLYEQYFVDVLPLPPDKQHQDTRRMMRVLLKAPFKNSAHRFRLRTLIQRFQTFETYWERVQKQREEGTYSKDKFKAEIRRQQAEEFKREQLRGNASDRGIQELYSSYQTALKKAGNKNDKVDFDSFKRSVMQKARMLREKHGVKKLHYKIVMKNGRVVVKASSRD